MRPLTKTPTIDQMVRETRDRLFVDDSEFKTQETRMLGEMNSYLVTGLPSELTEIETQLNQLHAQVAELEAFKDEALLNIDVMMNLVYQAYERIRIRIVNDIGKMNPATEDQTTIYNAIETLKIRIKNLVEKYLGTRTDVGSKLIQYLAADVTASPYQPMVRMDKAEEYVERSISVSAVGVPLDREIVLFTLMPLPAKWRNQTFENDNLGAALVELVISGNKTAFKALVGTTQVAQNRYGIQFFSEVSYNEDYRMELSVYRRKSDGALVYTIANTNRISFINLTANVSVLLGTNLVIPETFEPETFLKSDTGYKKIDSIILDESPLFGPLNIEDNAKNSHEFSVNDTLALTKGIAYGEAKLVNVEVTPDALMSETDASELRKKVLIKDTVGGITSQYRAIYAAFDSVGTPYDIPVKASGIVVVDGIPVQIRGVVISEPYAGESYGAVAFIMDDNNNYEVFNMTFDAGVSDSDTPIVRFPGIVLGRSDMFPQYAFVSSMYRTIQMFRHVQPYDGFTFSSATLSNGDVIYLTKKTDDYALNVPSSTEQFGRVYKIGQDDVVAQCIFDAVPRANGVFVDKNDNIFVFTETERASANGAYYVSQDGGLTFKVRSTGPNTQAITGVSIRAMAQNKLNNYFIATNKGLFESNAAMVNGVDPINETLGWKQIPKVIDVDLVSLALFEGVVNSVAVEILATGSKFGQVYAIPNTSNPTTYLATGNFVTIAGYDPSTKRYLNMSSLVIDSSGYIWAARNDGDMVNSAMVFVKPFTRIEEFTTTKFSAIPMEAGKNNIHYVTGLAVWDDYVYITGQISSNLDVPHLNNRRLYRVKVVRAGTRPTSSLVFEERWANEDFASRWLDNATSGECGVYADPSVPDDIGAALQMGNNADNDQVWKTSNVSIPLDKNKLYRIRCAIYNEIGDGTMYCGVAGRNAADDAWVNVNGANKFSSQYYFAANGIKLTPGSWSIFEGYFRGNTGALAGARPDKNAPGSFHALVASFRPLFIANYNGKAGKQKIGRITIEMLDPAIGDVVYIDATTWTEIAFVDGNPEVHSGAIHTNPIDDSILIFPAPLKATVDENVSDYNDIYKLSVTMSFEGKGVTDKPLSVQYVNAALILDTNLRRHVIHDVSL